MKLKKAVAIATAAGALAAISVPAMAFENEFHGMYRAYGIMTNAFSGAGGFNLKADSATDKYIEQRARLQYIAKASDDLKLVTHFEIDYKFGGASTSGKYVSTDGGGIDADRLNLETKSVYLDFKIPSTPVRVQAGMQPYNDSFGGLYGSFDATGVTAAANLGALKATYGYFTIGTLGSGVTFPSNANTQDLNTLDVKFAVNKNLTLGASYYLLLDKVSNTAISGSTHSATVANNTAGLNATAKFGPAEVTAAAGLQFGKQNNNSTTNALTTTGGAANLTNNGTLAYAAAVNAKVAVGPGKINVAGLYLSGDNDSPTAANKYNHAWNPVAAGVTYYSPANMWLLTRNIATINTSIAIGGTSDITRGGKGILGVFAGYDGTAGKLFYNANVGYAKVDRTQVAGASSSIGTEVNATIGYKLYDNMSASLIGAYAFLGDGYGKANQPLLNGTTVTKSNDDPFMTAIALNYAF